MVEAEEVGEGGVDDGIGDDSAAAHVDGVRERMK